MYKNKINFLLNLKKKQSRGVATIRMKAEHSEMHSCQGVIYFLLYYNTRYDSYP